jgi:phosphohistidine phosphatase
MKRIALLRHAKSSFRDPSLDDHDRPLNGRGRRVGPQMAGRYARESPVGPDCIVTSSALRAKTTAEFLARALADEGRAVRLDVRAELYLAEPERCFEVVWSLDERLRYAVLVGHNPGLCDFARELERGEGIGRLPTAALVVFEFDVERWPEVQPHGGRRVLYWIPKALGLG